MREALFAAIVFLSNHIWPLAIDAVSIWLSFVFITATCYVPGPRGIFGLLSTKDPRYVGRPGMKKFVGIFRKALLVLAIAATVVLAFALLGLGVVKLVEVVAAGLAGTMSQFRPF
jgi:hypothetical protein